MRDDYLDFEKRHTSKLDSLFYRELDPVIKEMLRQEILRQRVFLRDYWLAIGREVPSYLQFKSELQQGDTNE